MRLVLAQLVVLTALSVATARAADGPPEPGSVAFLGITFYDTSTEGDMNGIRPDETDRVELITDDVRDRMTEAGFTLADTAPVAGRLADTVNVTDCNGCELEMAAELNADYVLVGQVQKVSNLILSIKLVLRDVETGEMVRGQSVDIRSNTDQSWLRGVRYIFENNFFRA